MDDKAGDGQAAQPPAIKKGADGGRGGNGKDEGRQHDQRGLKGGVADHLLQVNRRGNGAGDQTGVDQHAQEGADAELALAEDIHP